MSAPEERIAATTLSKVAGQPLLVAQKSPVDEVVVVAAVEDVEGHHLQRHPLLVGERPGAGRPGGQNRCAEHQAQSNATRDDTPDVHSARDSTPSPPAGGRLVAAWVQSPGVSHDEPAPARLS